LWVSYFFDDITTILGFKKLQLLEKSEKEREANIIGFYTLFHNNVPE